MTRRYPLAPLFELTGWTMSDVRDIAPCGGEEYRLRRTEGVTERIADRLAVAAGLHPHVVWPEMAAHALEDASQPCADERCTNTFIPVRKSHRYCSRNCRNRRHERMKYRTDPEFRARKRGASQAYYAQVADYVKAQVRRRYWQSKGGGMTGVGGEG